MRDLKNVLLCTTAAVSLASAASAADIPVRKAPPKAIVAAPVTATWTGCYIGGHGGGGWGRKEFTNVVIFREAPGLITPNEAPIANETVDTDGWLGGVQGGCDYQFHPNWLVGIEGTFAWSNLKGSTTRTPFDPFLVGKTTSPGTLTLEAQTESLASLIGKFGLVQNNWMLYGLVGIAWARDKYHAFGTFDLEGGVVGSIDVSATENRTGLVAGAGLATLFGPNVSGFVEYNYFDFGGNRVAQTGTVDAGFTTGTAALTADIDQRIHVVKAGLNWRFGGFGKAPVVAKY